MGLSVWRLEVIIDVDGCEDDATLDKRLKTVRAEIAKVQHVVEVY